MIHILNLKQPLEKTLELINTRIRFIYVVEHILYYVYQ